MDVHSAAIRQAKTLDLPNIEALLLDLDLPVKRVKIHLNNFLVMMDGDEVAGVVGLEVYDDQALLRSLGVAGPHQGQGLGTRLYQAVLDKARSLDISTLVLLTETAEDFFANQGFVRIDRETVDPRIRASVEFESCCPASAACMQLKLTNCQLILEVQMKDGNKTDESIRSAVRKRYAGLATDAARSCCSGSSCCSPEDEAKGDVVISAGYSDADVQTVPADAVEHSYGCGNPLAFSDVKAGNVVLDIGSGAGIDCFIAAEKVGETGRVIGIDMTPEMIERARKNADGGGYANVEFRLGDAESMPVEDGSVDWVISNCVINLSPNKPKVFAEITRILKPGGRFAISDIVLGDDLPQSIAENIHAWTGCVAGAVRETEYLSGLEQAGISEVEVVSRQVYDAAVIRSFVASYDLIDSDEALNHLVASIEGKIWSAKIEGRK